MCLKMRYFLILLIIFTGVFGGGYFTYISTITLIPLLLILLYKVFKTKKIRIMYGWEINSIVFLIGGYLITPIWAVDSGMALTGFFKFLPILFFYLLLCYAPEEKEEVIQFLPVFGTIMTIFSMFMMQYPVFAKYILVSNRLSGFFQYPNTYALFMLICLIIVLDRIKLKQFDWVNYIYLIMSVLGICLSGSRIVFVLMSICGIFYLTKNIKRYSHNSLYIIFGIIIVLGLGFFLNKDSFFHLISSNFSTLWGRLLYDFDAIPLILKHPFGIGYYGYFFMEQQIQTGVYSILNVHNELFQFMLDIGWIPAIFFYGVLGENILSSQNCIRNRLILLIITVHSLFDFDFQFLIIFFILLLFLKNNNKIKEYSISLFTIIIMGISTLLVMVSSFKIGMSDFYYTNKKYDKASNFYKSNTRVQLQKAIETENVKEKETILREILKKNEDISITYYLLAQLDFSNGNINEFILYMDRAIELAPYEFSTYENYLDLLSYCVNNYVENNDTESAKICFQKMEEIPKKLIKVKEKTSYLGWKIKDLPKTKLSYEQLQLIEKTRRMLNE